MLRQGMERFANCDDRMMIEMEWGSRFRVRARVRVCEKNQMIPRYSFLPRMRGSGLE